MKHTLKLDEPYYNAIKEGIKNIELRLYDEKRRIISIGDTIEFLKQPKLKESIATIVEEIIVGKSFEEILERYPITCFAGKNITKKELLNDLNKFYSKQMQEEYGVVGIKVKLI